MEQGCYRLRDRLAEGTTDRITDKDAAGRLLALRKSVPMAMPATHEG